MNNWKSVIGYEGIYEVSSNGIVRSLDRIRTHRSGRTAKVKGRTLKQIKKDGIYKVVNLSKEGKTKTRYVHRLVAEHFIGAIPKGMAVNHIDHKIYNNHYLNLEIITRRDNTYHGLRNKNHTSKYAGVYWNKVRSKWIAMTRINGSNKIYLGGFDNEIDAHNAVLNRLKEENIQSIYA